MKMRVLASFIVWVSTTLNQQYIRLTSNICLTNYIED